VIAGARFYDASVADAGAAFVFRGEASGFVDGAVLTTNRSARTSSSVPAM
jgi:hypothetical protein